MSSPRASLRPSLKLIAAITLVVIGVGCSDGSERSDSDEAAAPTTTTAVPHERWQARTELACEQLNEQFAALAAADPGPSEQAVEYALEVDDFAEAIVGAIDEGAVPVDHEREAKELRELVVELERATTRFADGAERADASQMDTAVEQIDELGSQINGVATQLGVPACGGF